MRILKSLRLIILFPLVFLTACASGDGKPLPKMTFEHIAPVSVYVASYEVINDKGLTRLEGFMGDPAQSITDYFRNRFEPSGANGKLIARVTQASITHRVVKSENSFGAWLGVDRDDEYTIKAQVALQLYGLGGYQFREVKINAMRVVGISEHKSLIDRERLQMQAIDKLVDDIDQEAHKILKAQFGILD